MWAGTAQESLVHFVEGFLAFDFEVAETLELSVVAVGAVGLEEFEDVGVLAEVGTLERAIIFAILHLLQIFARYVFKGAMRRRHRDKNFLGGDGVKTAEE